MKEEIWNLIAKKLAGEASPEELLRLEQALREDPELHYSLQAIYDVWNANPQPQQEYIERAFAGHEKRLKALAPDYVDDYVARPLPDDPVHPRRKFLHLLAAISFFLLVFAGIWLATRPRSANAGLANLEPKKPSEVSTQYGTRTKLLLPDGSSVWLNAGSRLLYDSAYGLSLREVSLTGEAFFDVAPNKQKPFIIHTGNINIRVLGTAFNVKSYPGEKTIETSLIRGKIEVSFKDHSLADVILKPNQKLVISADTQAIATQGEKSPAPGVKHPAQVLLRQVSHFGPDSLVSETAWVENKLVFQDQSFSDLARQMERWYGVRIRFDDNSLDDLHFTGSFEKENIQQALRALQLLSQFKFSIRQGEVLIQEPD